MKSRFLFLLILLFFTGHSFAQPGFQRLYGTSGNQIMVMALPAASGGSYCFGATTAAGAGDADLVLMNVDNAGQVIWAKTYGGAYWDSPTYFVRASDGGLTAIGETKSFSGNTFDDMLFLKTDSLGNLLWAKIFSAASVEVPTCIIRTSDNGYAFTGFVTVNGHKQVFLIRANMNGDTLFTHIYGSGTGEDLGVGLTQSADGGFVISGKTSTNATGFVDVMLLKTDPAGNLQWVKSFGRGGWEEGESITVAHDGNYLVCGATNSVGYGDYDILLMKFDTAGNYLWGKIYGGQREDASYSVFENTDGSILVSGYTNSMGYGHNLSAEYESDETMQRNYPVPPTVQGDDSTNVFLLKTNAEGDTLWTRAYGNARQDEAFHFSPMPDGGYIIPGLSDSYVTGTDSMQMYLIRTDSLGFSGCHERSAHPGVDTVTFPSQNLPFNQTSGIPVTNVTLTVQQWNISADNACLYTAVSAISAEASLSFFPNPFSNYISFTLQQNEPLEVSVFNLLGEIVFQKEMQATEHQLDLSFLPQGAYILRLKKDSQTFFNKILKM